MDQGTTALLEALRFAAQEGAEVRLYRRGKLPGLFAQRAGLPAEAAQQALEQKLLEVTRVETEGKTTIEWARVTPKGMEFLLASQSPVRALDELRAALRVNQQGFPAWAAQMQERIDALTAHCAAEVTAMRSGFEQMARQVDAAIARLEKARNEAAPDLPWGAAAIDYLERRAQVGLGTRCPLADLFTTLKQKHADLSIKDFHNGLKQLQGGNAIELLPGLGPADTPGPEYALLDGASLYYYVARADLART
jgi:hypothetical protein